MTTKRSPYDFYPTPTSAIDKLLDCIHLNGKTILEPCAGDGVIINAIAAKCDNVKIDAIEIDATHLETLQTTPARNILIQDYLATTDLAAYDTIITNPPFSIAQEILEHTFKNAKTGTSIYMLLRLNFLGSQKRHEFWKKYPPNAIWVLSKRPSFTGNGTDSQEYAWFHWTIGCSGANNINVI